MELRQGKCTNCIIAYRWPSNYMRLRDAYCPLCGEKLASTNHLLRWEWVNQNPVGYKVAFHLRQKGGQK